MRKIIGGLLVVSLLSRPAILNVSYLAYQVLKVQNQIICVSKRDEEEEIIEATDIDDVLAEIENNKRVITTLLKEKEKFVAKIQSLMDVFSYSKITLKEEQMKTFGDFSDNYSSQNVELHNIIVKLEDDTEINKVKKEFFKKDTNLRIIYTNLKKILNYQLQAIKVLENIIFMAKATITVF